MSGSNEKAVEKLVQEMGFNRTEVTMALRDTSGDVEKAVEKLLSGEYAPPPYTTTGAEGAHLLPQTATTNENENSKDSKLYPNMHNIFSGLTNRGKMPDISPEDPTAPPLYQSVVDMPSCSEEDIPKINALPPPYQKLEKETKIKDWEVDMNVVYLNSESNDNNVGFSIASRSERCPVCFNAVLTATGGARSGGNEEIVCHNGKVFHHSCFAKKHGPKCAHCCFPLAQADKDHELSGKYLVYKHKDYHVECYEKFAGPRCAACFNVIIEKPNGECSGQWVVDNNQEFHIECLQKKLYATWRAKNS